jgi:rfaE bifunctional protein nucleotidyltransferase chain/domain
LKDARSRGEYLVVAVNTDASARELKGKDLPVHPFRERVEVLSALECVDYITPLKEKTADLLLDLLRPNIHAKGTDYTVETVPERDTVLAYGGAIAIVGDPKDHSTSGLIERVGKIAASKGAAGRKRAGKSARKAASRTGKAAGARGGKKTISKRKTRKTGTAKKKAAKKKAVKKAAKKAKKTGSGSRAARKRPAAASARTRAPAAKRGMKRTARERAMGAG